MTPRTRAAATRSPPAAVPAPRPPLPPPAARRHRQVLPAPPDRAASGRPKEELQEESGAAATPASGAERPGGLPAQHGPGRIRRREAARDGSLPARRRAKLAAVSLSPPAAVCSPVPSEVNRPVTRSISQSARANAAVANENTNTTDMRTRTGYIESLRRQLIVAHSEVIEEKHNVRRGLEKIRRKDAELQGFMEKHITALKRIIQMMDDMQKLRTEKEAEIQELKVQKQAELQKVKVHKEAEVQKVIEENIRLLRIVDKKEAQLQAMSEHCKLLALKHHN